MEHIHTADLISLLVSILCGGLIGIEREYKNKSAGFRTMILICFGSTIFTIISRNLGDDRVASTVVTGIGFIGAGVIFKDNLWVKGLTTSAVIWVSASIGMLIGSGENLLALVATAFVLAILSVFHYIEKLIDIMHHRKEFSILFAGHDLQHLHSLEQYISMRKLSSKRVRISKEGTGVLAVIDVSGNRSKIYSLNEYMVSLPEIKSFNVV